MYLRKEKLMEWKTYKTIQEFYDENIEILLKEEPLNNLIIGNVYSAFEMENIEDWILARIMNKGKVEMIFLYRPPYKLLCYAPNYNYYDIDGEIYTYAAKHLYKMNPCLLGINAEKKIANSLADSYINLSKQRKQTELRMRILVLQNLKDIVLAEEVVFRKAKEEDKDVISENIRIFYEEALGKIQDIKQCQQEFKEQLLMGLYVIEKDGKIVSQAALKRKLTNGKNISSVYTPREERGKGYAKTCVYLLSKKCLEEGAKYCVLYADDTNPISNHVYESIGYKKIANQESICFLS